MKGACAKNVELFQVMGFKCILRPRVCSRGFQKTCSHPPCSASSRANVDGVYSVNAELSPYAYIYPTSADEDPMGSLFLGRKISSENPPGINSRIGTIDQAPLAWDLPIF
ncbi:hypothetical protein BDBG_02202 [Blastomyces gilchristii SLH14081]|uniref:Uncharacterized protein n=1 Tax=Blastomyces gilchristii (strain SLH14081) TaxID=559298 RepID=A0A179UDS3_BLAGS|nr:uncharacterized protein BDBG_02202 [Blastomyces gilchristii SLH14081]OAT05883.1 hypothetical protein BDBG_02202 [Blastomyces gilchristii SLH14081]